MRLIIILFLCSRLLPSSAQESFSKEIDCNDKEVFKAVDAALKKYNGRNQSGNQFVLYRITQVNKTESYGTFYSFQYEVKEGDCPVQSNKTWQDCDYKEAAGAATGECTATVKSKGERFIVSTQTCQITPAEGPVIRQEYNCLGCTHPIPPESPELEPVLRHAIGHFNNQTDRRFLFTLHKVTAAQRQVVSGWNYEIIYSIMQTNCSKEHFQFLTPDCKSLLNGDSGECRDLAYMDPQLKITSFTQNCELYPGEEFVPPPPKICAGCPIAVAFDSPDLVEPLKHSVAKLNAENNGPFYFKIDHVEAATVQVVAGRKFSITFIARETTCSKERHEELTSSCENKDAGKALRCKADIYEVPWQGKIHPTVNCQALVTGSLRKRPPGFTPFRSVSTNQAGTGEVTTVSAPHTSMAAVQDEEQDPGKEQGPIHGHGWDHEKPKQHGLAYGYKLKHDQGHGHQRGHGLGHGHQQKLDYDLEHHRGHDLGHGHQQKLDYDLEHHRGHGLGHGHQQKLDYDLEHHRGHGLGHGHQKGHGLAHGHKHERGHGHGNHKDNSNGKHNDWRTEHGASSSEDSTTPSTQAQEKTDGPTPVPSLAQPGIAVTFADFQDSDLIAAVMPITPPPPTESDDDWIPDIQVEPNSHSFNLISDFPEITSPKCPGRPWKPVDGMNPSTEVKELYDFDLSDACSWLIYP